MIKLLILPVLYILGVINTIYWIDSKAERSNRIVALIQDCEYITRAPLEGWKYAAIMRCNGKLEAFESM